MLFCSESKFSTFNLSRCFLRWGWMYPLPQPLQILLLMLIWLIIIKSCILNIYQIFFQVRVSFLLKTKSCQRRQFCLTLCIELIHPAFPVVSFRCARKHYSISKGHLSDFNYSPPMTRMNSRISGILGREPEFFHRLNKCVNGQCGGFEAQFLQMSWLGFAACPPDPIPGIKNNREKPLRDNQGSQAVCARLLLWWLRVRNRRLETQRSCHS